MSAQTLYSGPAKAIMSLGATPTPTDYQIQPEGENGALAIAIDTQTTQRASAMFGRMRETLDDVTAKITTTPFDSWELLPILFPAFIGVKVGLTAAALMIGARPHDQAAGSANGTAPTKIWTPDGRLYNMVRTAITKHPGMKLGVSQPLFEGIEITCLGDPTKNIGDAGFILAGSAITESGAADPLAGVFQGASTGSGATGPDFVNGHWTAAWGAITGFTAMEAEDYFQLVVDVKYSPLTVQKCTRHMKLDSVNYMVKFRPAGPTHTQIAGKVLAQTLGATLAEGSATDLVLTGPSSKTITLKDAEIKGAGFEFGGTRLGTGEVGFVNKMDFTTGAPTSLLEFSA